MGACVLAGSADAAALADDCSDIGVGGAVGCSSGSAMVTTSEDILRRHVGASPS